MTEIQKRSDEKPYGEDDVRELADVIAEAHMSGIRFGSSSLARWILDRGWRKEQR